MARTGWSSRRRARRMRCAMGRLQGGQASASGRAEREVISYRTAVPGFAPPWEAEVEAVALRAAKELPAIEARLQALPEELAELDRVRRALARLVMATAKRQGKTCSQPSARRRPQRKRAAR